MNRTSFTVPLANGVFDQPLPGALPGYHQLVLSFVTRPTAGRLALFSKTGPDDDWLPVADSQNVDLTSTRVLIAFGAIQAYRFVISGLVGGSGMNVWLSSGLEWPGPGMPEGVFSGDRAMTTQDYISANVKNGLQYEVSALTPSLAAGANSDTVFVTGAHPVLIKSRIVKFNGLSLATRVYRGPTFTGGTVTPYFNLNDRNPITGGVVIRTGATVTAPGVEFGAPTFDIGTDGQGNSSYGTFSVSGIERLLAPNTTYLLRITNDSAAPQRVSAYLTWYEGPTDLPLN